MKVNYKENTSVQFIFYSTWSVNIQGSTCATFKSQYFGQLDAIVQRMAEESPSDEVNETKLMKIDDNSNTDASRGYTLNEQSKNTGASNQCTVESTQNEQPKTPGHLINAQQSLYNMYKAS